MRTGLYREVPSPDDQRLSRIQKNLKDAVDVLSADHDVLSVPITTYVVTGAIAAGKSVVAFRGNTGQTLTLPQAKAQGPNVSAVIIFANTSPNAVTLIPTPGDALNGALTLAVAAGAVLVLTSDGVNKWLAPASSGASETTGIATLAFGATPTTDATVAVAGQAGILTTSKVQCWIEGATTATNTEDDHVKAAALLAVTARIPTAGVGFTIDGSTIRDLVSGDFEVKWAWQ